MTGAITIRFPDGAIIEAPDAVGALTIWREKQWSRSDEEGFREELAKRAYVWSSVIINVKGTALELLRECERAGLIKIEEGN